MKNEPTPALTPKLRFPEFRDAKGWDADALGDVADFVNEKIPLERVALENYVSTENILPNYGGVAKASKLPTTGSVTRYKPNDTLVSNIRPYLKKVWVADKEGGASNDVIVIRAKQSLLPQYFSCLLKNDAFINYVMTGAKGVKMPRGDVGSMKTYPTLYPSKAEQQKIAECLSSVDELIAAQARKVDALKTHKKGLMQQLFPREGETQPRLRFPEFQAAGEWVPRTLGSVCSSFSGGTPSTSQPEYYGGDIPFIRSAEIGREKTELFLTSAGLTNSASKIVAKGDVLVALYGANSGDVALARIDGAINQAILCLKSKESNGFIFQFLSFKKDWVVATYLQGGQGNLSGEIVKSISVCFPSPDEQQRIADSLTSLDDLLAAQTQKLAALKTHKKGLMQQLFPSPAEVEA